MMAPIIIDNEIKLKVLLAHIAERVREKEDQLVFVDLEGVDLSRRGTVAIMQLLIPPDPLVYLIDVYVLGAKAFEVTVDVNTSLKSVLESRTIFKVFFDIRNDSDALYAHFGINIAGVIDLQVIEYATRQPRGKFVHGLAKCIERDLPYTPGWSLIKANGRRLFAPEAGGKYEVFLERPLAADIVKYCEQDVILMPQLLAFYGPKLRSGVAAQIQTIVDDRIRLSKTATFNGKGRHMAIGPPLAAPRDYMNMPTSHEVELVCSIRLGQLCCLDDAQLDDLTSQFSVLQVKQEPRTVSCSGTSDLDWTAGAAHSAASTSTTLVVSPANTSVEPLDGNEDESDLLIPPVVTSTETPDGDDEDEWDGSFGDEDLVWRTGYADIDRDSDFDPDFTACSADDCGYCGKCPY